MKAQEVVILFCIVSFLKSFKESPSQKKKIECTGFKLEKLFVGETTSFKAEGRMTYVQKSIRTISLLESLLEEMNQSLACIVTVRTAFKYLCYVYIVDKNRRAYGANP